MHHRITPLPNPPPQGGREQTEFYARTDSISHERVLNRHGDRLEGAIAVDEVDALLNDAQTRAVAAQPMALPAGEEALHLVAILDHDHGRADDVFAFGLVRLLEEHVADEVRRARGRRLHVDAGMLQALDARLHQLAVVIEQRSLIERAR